MRKNYGKFLKRIIVLLAAVFLFASAFTLAGCSSKKNSDEETWSDFY
ncbi:MAG: hypothetical protein IJY62_01255 [Clostridia bacterium]|nr:hypothetical protein [Clostridia bacterium]